MKGFTLIEVLVALAIVAILAVIGINSFSNFNAQEALSVEAEKVVSLLAAARAETLAAKGGAQYGVHFEERRVVLFQGAAYNASDPTNRIQELHRAVKIANIELADGGSEVVFAKLTGATAQSGSAALALVRKPSGSKVITIEATGIASAN